MSFTDGGGPALGVVFAVLTAAANAAGTVLQRVAARSVPENDAFSIRLVGHLMRNRAWFAGIAVIVFAAVVQAAALAWGSLTLVQPILVAELPLALLFAYVFTRTPMPPGGWTACLLTSCGLALALGAAAPAEGHRPVDDGRWVMVLAVTAASVVLCAGWASRRPYGKARAVLFGLGSAIAYGLTAALMKSAMEHLEQGGVPGLATTWQTYGCVAAGAAALFLLTNAMGSGPLFVSQPALTLGEAAASLLLGAVLYGDQVRTGWWLGPQSVGAALTVYGVLLLTRAQPEKARETEGRSREDPGP
ncbi:DMT family transporter [Streptomyces sp. NPDC021093]|uniref:DMT family transporter n=1 Tax=Streptomyces sp. NPDC021093 TaxID=3365112 RepID=UPI0037A6E247